MNIKFLRNTAAKLLTAGLVAGALALAVPATANAQDRVFFQGNTHTVSAGYGRDRRFEYDRFRAEQFRRREEWRRERFEHRFDHRYDQRFYR